MTTLNFDVANFLKYLTQRPGVYKMLNDKGKIIYIGKAKNLKNRVSSYFRGSSHSPRQQVMVAKISNIEVTVTHTEGEALLLESQQIKQYQPRYNICLRDDKSYPYLFISKHHYPQITFHRGAKKKQGQYFGPYPSAGAVKQTLKILQNIFPVRQCEDSFFSHRTRPCLQYQIERCTAPCVGLITPLDYEEDVDNTVLFLEGKNDVLIEQLIAKMEAASRQLKFERATMFRDQITRLRRVLEKHFVHGKKGNVDIIACASKAGIASVQVFFIRNGQNLGNKAFFPKITPDFSENARSENTCPENAILQAFISQYYLDKPIPSELLVSHVMADAELLTDLLSRQANHPVTISTNVRKERLKWLQMAQTNAENSLLSQLADKQNMYAKYLNLQELLGWLETPKRLECFDISHTQGDYTVASCVVFNQQGPLKSAYRRFNITDITPGDDCAAIYQAVLRRFKRLKQGEHTPPDILFIDGGKGQVSHAQKALQELQLNNVTIVGVAKGAGRKAGMEKLLLADQQPLNIMPGASALLLIQYIRDEAHRFAITAHRLRRGKGTKKSMLESIIGLGNKRRQYLLKQFGGLQGVSNAGVDALCSINGISRQLAQRIYDNFHHDDH